MFGLRANQRNNENRNGRLIELKRVVKVYETEAGDFPALKGIDLTVERGEFISITGKSGAGKSTLINMISGIDRVTSGEVWVDGTAVHTMNETQMALAGKYSVRERRERAMYLLEQVSIPEQAHKRPQMLSGGQQQRAAVARALANNPPIILADEPTGNLDSRTASRVFEVFEKLVDQGTSMLMVTHDEEMARRVHRNLTLVDGQIVDEKHLNARSTISQNLRARGLVPQGAYAS
jgi:putative ABC transport system ATP-binding protein